MKRLVSLLLGFFLVLGTVSSANAGTFSNLLSIIKQKIAPKTQISQVGSKVSQPYIVQSNLSQIPDELKTLIERASADLDETITTSSLELRDLYPEPYQLKSEVMALWLAAVNATKAAEIKDSASLEGYRNELFRIITGYHERFRTFTANEGLKILKGANTFMFEFAKAYDEGILAAGPMQEVSISLLTALYDSGIFPSVNTYILENSVKNGFFKNVNFGLAFYDPIKGNVNFRHEVIPNRQDTEIIPATVFASHIMQSSSDCIFLRTAFDNPECALVGLTDNLTSYYNDPNRNQIDQRKSRESFIRWLYNSSGEEIRKIAREIAAQNCREGKESGSSGNARAIMPSGERSFGLGASSSSWNDCLFFNAGGGMGNAEGIGGRNANSDGGGVGFFMPTTIGVCSPRELVDGGSGFFVNRLVNCMPDSFGPFGMMKRFYEKFSTVHGISDPMCRASNTDGAEGETPQERAARLEREKNREADVKDAVDKAIKFAEEGYRQDMAAVRQAAEMAYQQGAMSDLGRMSPQEGADFIISAIFGSDENTLGILYGSDYGTRSIIHGFVYSTLGGEPFDHKDPFPWKMNRTDLTGNNNCSAYSNALNSFFDCTEDAIGGGQSMRNLNTVTNNINPWETSEGPSGGTGGRRPLPGGVIGGAPNNPESPMSPENQPACANLNNNIFSFGEICDPRAMGRAGAISPLQDDCNKYAEWFRSYRDMRSEQLYFHKVVDPSPEAMQKELSKQRLNINQGQHQRVGNGNFGDPTPETNQSGEPQSPPSPLPKGKK